MADMFYSKEILKNINKTPYQAEEGMNMRKIRGLYVVGVWRPPHYIDRGFFITGIGGTPAHINQYSDRTEQATPGGYVVGLKSVSLNPKLHVVKYSQTTEQITPGGYVIGLSDASLSTMNLVKYTQNLKDVTPGGYVVGLTDTSLGPKLTIDKWHITSYDDLPPGPPTLQISAIGGTIAEIT